MQFSAMIQMVRDVMADPSAALISDTLIKSLINLSEQDIYNRIVGVNEKHFAKSATLSWIANQETYNLPLDYKRMILVSRTDQQQPFNLNPDDLTRKNEYWSQVTLFNTPRHVYWFAGGQIGFSPIPTITATANISIWYVMLCPALVNNTDAPPVEWPPEHHEVIVWGAVNRAARRLKEKGDLYNDIYQGLLTQLLNEVQTRTVQDSKYVEPPPDADY